MGERYAPRRLIPAVGPEATELLELDDRHVVAELEVHDHPETAPRSLGGLDSALVGLRLLGVRKGGAGGPLIADPPEDLDLVSGDTLVVSGDRDRIQQIAADPGVTGR